VDRDRIVNLAEQEDDPAAKRTLRGLRTLSFQLSGAQLGITVTSLVVGFIAEPTIGRAIQPLVERAGVGDHASLGIAVTIALIVATSVQMVVGELIPKNLAIARPEPVALRVVTPLRIVNGFFRPLILFLNASANWAVRRLGIEPRDELTAVRSLQELELLIESSRAGGTILEEEFALLSKSISFAKRTAGDVLVPRTAIEGIERTASVADVALAAIDTGHSRFPVYVEGFDDLVGVVHVKDILRVPFEERPTTRVEHIVRDAFIVPESMALDALLVQMRSARQSLAVVVDEYGGTSGIVSMEDIIEEIVGEIEDEHDPQRSANQPREAVPSGVFLLDGRLHAGEVEDACGFAMPEGPYDTLAGFLLWLFDGIPGAGDHVAFDDWEFKVVDMDGRRIARVLVVAPEAKEPER
jgi:CBS domain containing-hemolysin-like protein